MDKKLIVTQVATELIDGKLTHVRIPLDRSFTIDEIGEEIKKMVDKCVEHVKNQCQGHEISHAIMVYPLMHVIFDEVARQDPDYQAKLQAERN